MHDFDLTTFEIVGRLVAAIIMGGIIGFEREYKSRPAGMKTHILVCVGATLLALIQEEVSWQIIQFARSNPDLIGVVSTDETRLTAQIVSGIGFLGAGTIIMTRQTVTGLTTAASVWSVAGVGISLGMGYYKIAFAGCLCIFLALTMITYLIPLPRIRRVQVELDHWEETNRFIRQYLRKQGITVDSVDFEIRREDDADFRSYMVMYTLTLPKTVDDDQMILDLSENKDIKMIRIIN